ncbi:MAG: TfoX/Sxy family protein [Saprospiraceae bacterium]|nr:TfoX/Sxy family protein [Saprospiraceae bacterium]
MAYDDHLADRILQSLRRKTDNIETKKMFGGLCYMVDGKMCVGAVGDKIMARIGPASYEESLTKAGCMPMDFTGRPMKGYVFVNDQGYDLDIDLDHWVDLALAFNPIAKSSKKKRK